MRFYIMDIETLKNYFASHKRGIYTKLTKKTNKNGFIKIVHYVVRFVNYYNIKEIKAQNKTSVKCDYERVIIPHILKENTHTNNILLSCYTTKNHSAKTSYFYNDDAITEGAYYEGIKEKKPSYNISNIFTVNINDIVAIG